MFASFRRFWSQLKRRRVIKTLVAYAIATWLLVQVASIVFPALEFPEEAMRYVVLLSFAGVIPVILLAWLFDVVRTDPEPSEEQPGANSDQAATLSISAPPSLDSAIASVAVLPFDNLTEMADQAYYADGIAFELHSTLSKLHRLRVASRKSSFAFRDSEKDIKEIAQALSVKYILSGSVRFVDGRIRVIAELDNAEEGVQIWTHTYLRDIDSIFDLESEIAQAIVGAFGAERLRAEINRAVHVPTHNLDAWGRVQKARSYLLKYNKNSIEEAVNLLENAIELDPDYAAAHAMLGSILAERNLNGLSDDAESDRMASTQAIARAQELDGDDAFVLKMAGVVLAYEGQLDESIRMLRRAVRLAPYDFGAWGYFGWPLVSTGKEDDLVELHSILDRLLEVAPGHPGVAYWLFHKSVAYSCQSNNTKAMEYARRSTDERPDYSLAWMQYANILGHDNQVDAAAKACANCERLNKAMTSRHYEQTVNAMSDSESVLECRLGGLRKAALL
ncbi:MAG: tetratricopeptide repeat protein [Gammaproteobacteria bacterium]